ncbi:hypothetical protein ATCC90586_004665 [Pythium insidiosum]|nr:hypothetical protein ATCC90586_004665 [Pythium insidiosum]
MSDTTAVPAAVKEAIAAFEPDEESPFTLVPPKPGETSVLFSWGVRVSYKNAKTGSTELGWICLGSQACREKWTRHPLYGGKTSNGTRHLKDFHQVASDKTQTEANRKRSIDDQVEELRSSIMNRQEPMRLRMLIEARDIIMTNSPFCSGESEDKQIKDKFMVIEEYRTSISASCVRHSLVELYVATRREVMMLLKTRSTGVKSINLVMDFWSCPPQKAKYLGIRAYFIDSGWKFRSVLLGIRRFDPSYAARTQDGLRGCFLRWVEGILSHFNIVKTDVFGSMTDGAGEVKRLSIDDLKAAWECEIKKYIPKFMIEKEDATILPNIFSRCSVDEAEEKSEQTNANLELAECNIDLMDPLVIVITVLSLSWMLQNQRKPRKPKSSRWHHRRELVRAREPARIRLTTTWRKSAYKWLRAPQAPARVFPPASTASPPQHPVPEYLTNRLAEVVTKFTSADSWMRAFGVAQHGLPVEPPRMRLYRIKLAGFTHLQRVAVVQSALHEAGFTFINWVPSLAQLALPAHMSRVSAKEVEDDTDIALFLLASFMECWSSYRLSQNTLVPAEAQKIRSPQSWLSSSAGAEPRRESSASAGSSLDVQEAHSFTGFVLAKAMQDTSALAVAQAYDSTVFQRYGASSVIRHDRDPRENTRKL